jgi:hypothetical protein
VKKYLGYLAATLLLGVFMGILMSFGNDILLCIGISWLFWAGMLTPMLID